MSLITKHIYLGGQKAALNADCLKHFGITHIIDMMDLFSSQEESKTNLNFDQSEDKPKRKENKGRGLFEDQFEYLVFTDCKDTQN